MKSQNIDQLNPIPSRDDADQPISLPEWRAPIITRIEIKKTLSSNGSLADQDYTDGTN